jgi:hypothetical protein
VADEPIRSRAARQAAERALIRVVHHYGARPEFVVLGGLVPELLCSASPFSHAGTTDVDVQVNLEIATGSVNAARLERALRNAEFEPDHERVWRWRTDGKEAVTEIKFELLADLDEERAGITVIFDGCEALGAANLRGTGFAVRDVEVHRLRARVGGVTQEAEINVTGLAGFLLAKAAAAHGRRKPKDWYDIAYVLLHNNAGGPREAADRVRALFQTDIPALRTSLDDLRDNFADPAAQGAQAYADSFGFDHPERDHHELAVEALAAVNDFHDMLVSSR